MTVAMALAESSSHHSSRGQKTARAGVWGREMNYTATIRDPPTPQPELFSLYEEPSGARLDRLSEVRPQDRDLRRTVDQIVDAVPGLPALDVLVPQMVDRPLVARGFRRPCSRAGYRSAQDVDAYPLPLHGSLRAADSGQLVEAPNVVSLIDVIRHPVEQTVGGGRIGGLPGFLPGQSYSLSAEQIVDYPVPRFRRGFGGGLHGLQPGQSSSAFYGADHRVPAATAEQNVDIPAPRGCASRFSSKSFSCSWFFRFAGNGKSRGFSHFSLSEKSAMIPRTQGSELGADFSSWPP